MDKTIGQIRVLYASTTILLVLVQSLFFPEWKNLACLAMILVGCGISGWLGLRREAFLSAPLSSMVVMMFSISNLFVPLLGVTLDWKPLTYNLWVPIQTFGYTTLTVVLASLVHRLYRNWKAGYIIRNFVADEIFSRLQLFKPPTSIQLWVIGGVGCMALAAADFLFSRTSLDVSGFVPQLVNGFQPFAGAPLIILVAPYFWKAPKPNRGTWALIVLYMGLVAILSLAYNGRGKFVIPVVTVLEAVLLAIFIGRIKINLFRPAVIVPTLILVVVFMPFLSDLATAMRGVRAKRSRLTGVEMVEETFGALMDPSRMARFKNDILHPGVRAGDWDERYLDNEFLQRLTPLKYTDNAMYYTRDYSPQDREKLANFSWAHIPALFPSPILRLFGISFNKWAVITMSFGDYIYYSRTGFEFAGFRTGAMIPIGLALHGPWFFLIFALLIVPVFLLMDCFCRRVHYLAQGKPMIFLMISPLFLINLYAFSIVLNVESLMVFGYTFIRFVPQLIVLYLVLFIPSLILNYMRFGRGNIRLLIPPPNVPTNPPRANVPSA